MWLRDSANQVQSYLPLLEASSDLDSLASLYRGVINLQSRYLLTDPYCNSFQPPVESGLPPSFNEYSQTDVVKPVYNNASVFECKYELDSLAAFLEVSYDYYNATQDVEFFGKYSWVSAVEATLKVAEEMMESSYYDDGSVNNISYTWTRETTRSTETTANSKNDVICERCVIDANLNVRRWLRQPFQQHRSYSKLLPPIRRHYDLPRFHPSQHDVRPLFGGYGTYHEGAW